VLRRALPGALPLVAAALVAGGCGTGGKAAGQTDAQNGQKLFQSKCAGCHTLAAAGSRGTIGPNLDDAFAEDRREKFEQSTIQNVVLDQIRQAAAPMPRNLVTGSDAQDVAAYVASSAGLGGGNAKSPAQLGTNGKAIFSAECSSCHTLKAAGATGTVGPNLDQLKPPFKTAQRQVTHGGAVMPAFKGVLSPAQIDAVAKFVAGSAGK
jgi:cbb3-type cytochrome c oxidase subunit III